MNPIVNASPNRSSGVRIKRKSFRFRTVFSALFQNAPLQIDRRSLSTVGSLLILIALNACGVSDEEEPKWNRLNQVAKVSMAGANFDIPIGYMYYETLLKRGKLPTVKHERVNVSSLSLDALLPGLRKFSPGQFEEWKRPGHGNRLNILMTVNKAGPELIASKRSKFRSPDGARARYHEKIRMEYGLEAYSGRWDKEYFSISDDLLNITCTLPEVVPYPSCDVWFYFRERISVKYTYGLSFLKTWRQIHADVIKFLNSLNRN